MYLNILSHFILSYFIVFVCMTFGSVVGPTTKWKVQSMQHNWKYNVVEDIFKFDLFLGADASHIALRHQ